MIIIKLFNGLGNQLFQYACGRAVQEKYGGELYLDISDFKNNKREYGLNKFKLNDNIKIIEKDTSFFNLRKNLSLKIGCKLMPKITFKIFSPWGKYLYLGEEYIEIEKNFANKYYLYGYWQSEKYFNEIKKIIKDELILKEKIKETHQSLIKEMEEENSVAVHIRRGDYINNKLYKDICNKEYYQKAIKIIREKIKNPVFYIFSDEIDWCKNNLKWEGTVHFMNKENKDYEDLNLMSHCKHYIIANSSFSWWGQYLGNYSDKMVIAPKKWYNHSKKADIYMNNWITI